MVDDCTVMPRSSGGDRVRFCGANDRDYEIFSAAAEGLGIEVRERTDDLPHLCLQGPNSRAILQGMTTSDLSSEAFPYYTFREDVEVAGIPVFMTRLGYTAELGYELWVDRDRALDLWDALLRQGAGHGMEVIGMDALDLFRIEGGFIIGGVEYDPTVSPYECGLGWAVDLDKPGFQGRVALQGAEQASTLRLASVALETGGAEATGAELTAGGSVVGVITQAVVSPYLEGKTLGLAKVDRNRTEPGTAVEALVAGEAVPGTIVRHPAYDPERRRVRG
jgi:aminomethyltransferase